MAVDLNFRKVKKFIFIFFFILISTTANSKNYNFEKLGSFSEPWGSSFINSEELIITEKGGKIKIINIVSKNISEIKHNLNYFVHGQGGLLDIIHKDKKLWISYHVSENIQRKTR